VCHSRDIPRPLIPRFCKKKNAICMLLIVAPNFAGDCGAGDFTDKPGTKCNGYKDCMCGAQRVRTISCPFLTSTPSWLSQNFVLDFTKRSSAFPRIHLETCINASGCARQWVPCNADSSSDAGRAKCCDFSGSGSGSVGRSQRTCNSFVDNAGCRAGSVPIKGLGRPCDRWSDRACQRVCCMCCID
jgi:hypothetical protein